MFVWCSPCSKLINLSTPKNQIHCSKKICNKIALSYLYVLSKEKKRKKNLRKNNEDGIKIID